MQSKVSRLTHEVVDGVCLHLTMDDARILSLLLERGVNNTPHWCSNSFKNPRETTIRETGYKLASDIVTALKEAPPTCKE